MGRAMSSVGDTGSGAGAHVRSEPHSIRGFAVRSHRRAALALALLAVPGPAPCSCVYIQGGRRRPAGSVREQKINAPDRRRLDARGCRCREIITADQGLERAHVAFFFFGAAPAISRLAVAVKERYPGPGRLWVSHSLVVGPQWTTMGNRGPSGSGVGWTPHMHAMLRIVFGNACIAFLVVDKRLRFVGRSKAYSLKSERDRAGNSSS
jgi:hypothetical protein